MVERLIANLPMNAGEFTYICEHGHTHLVIPLPAKQRNRSKFYGVWQHLPGDAHRSHGLDCLPWKINLLSEIMRQRAPHSKNCFGDLLFPGLADSIVQLKELCVNRG